MTLGLTLLTNQPIYRLLDVVIDRESLSLLLRDRFALSVSSAALTAFVGGQLDDTNGTRTPGTSRDRREARSWP